LSGTQLPLRQKKAGAQSAAVAQVVGQFLPLPLHWKGEQLGAPGAPVSRAQVPLAQLSHAPSQATLQQ
jgi:hypothetical protein